MANHSVYARNAFLIILAQLGAPTLFLVVLLFVIYFCAHRLPPRFHRAAAMSVCLILIAIQVALVAFWGLLSGFDYVPAVVSFLVSVVTWVPVIAICMTVTSASWKTTLLYSSSKKTETDEGDREPVKTPRCSAIVSLYHQAVRSSLRQPGIYFITSVFSFCFTFAVILSTYGVCTCTNPVELTTWASRRSDAHVCQDKRFCHLYSTLGKNCSRLRVVGHIISSDEAPIRAVLSLCLSSAATASCTGSMTTVEGAVIDYAHLSEDRRYLAHFLLKDLSGKSVYLFHAAFYFPSGVVAKSQHVKVRTVSCPDDNSEEIVFCGGGDIHQSERAHQLLMVASRWHPNMQFFFIGGDVAYSQNLRTCYLRWDHFLRMFTSTRTADGTQIPLVTTIGNHEAGGYLREKDPADYNFYLPYLPQFDEDEPVNPWITHHSHDIGKYLRLIALDSGIMETEESQIPFLTEQLAMTRSPANLAETKFPIPLYHNPIYPSVREIDEKTSRGVRKLFMPLFDQYRVPISLEFHDHMYKRTFKMNNGVARNDGDGTIYIGDGSLGLYESDRDLNGAAYLEKAVPSDYVNCVVFHRNATAEVIAYGPGASVLDRVLIDRRLH